MASDANKLVSAGREAEVIVGVSGQATAAQLTVAASGHAATGGPADGAGAVVLPVDAAAALAALGSSRRGLGEDEGVPRRAAAGPNTLPRPRRRPAVAELAAQLGNMFAVVLMVAAGLTFVVYFLSSPRDAANLV